MLAVDTNVLVRLIARDDAAQVRVAEGLVAKGQKHPKVEFSDCLVLEIAKKAGHTPLVTVDRDFAKVIGVQPFPLSPHP
jgi:predicted nucleic acid-binding protein